MKGQGKVLIASQTAPGKGGGALAAVSTRQDIFGAVPNALMSGFNTATGPAGLPPAAEVVAKAPPTVQFVEYPGDDRAPVSAPPGIHEDGDYHGGDPYLEGGGDGDERGAPSGAEIEETEDELMSNDSGGFRRNPRPAATVYAERLARRGGDMAHAGEARPSHASAGELSSLGAGISKAYLDLWGSSISGGC